jgi:hypothetical protein
LENTESELTPLAVTFRTAKKLSGLGFTKLWALAKQGRIQLVYVDRRTLISFPSLQALLTPQATSEPQLLRPSRGRPRKLPQPEASG